MKTAGALGTAALCLAFACGGDSLTTLPETPAGGSDATVGSAGDTGSGEPVARADEAAPKSWFTMSLKRDGNQADLVVGPNLYVGGRMLFDGPTLRWVYSNLHLQVMDRSTKRTVTLLFSYRPLLQPGTRREDEIQSVTYFETKAVLSDYTTTVARCPSGGCSPSGVITLSEMTTAIVRGSYDVTIDAELVEGNMPMTITASGQFEYY